MKTMYISDYVKEHSTHNIVEGIGRRLPFQGGRFILTDDKKVIDTNVINGHVHPLQTFFGNNGVKQELGVEAVYSPSDSNAVALNKTVYNIPTLSPNPVSYRLLYCLSVNPLYFEDSVLLNTALLKVKYIGDSNLETTPFSWVFVDKYSFVKDSKTYYGIPAPVSACIDSETGKVVSIPSLTEIVPGDLRSDVLVDTYDSETMVETILPNLAAMALSVKSAIENTDYVFFDKDLQGVSKTNLKRAETPYESINVETEALNTFVYPGGEFPDSVKKKPIANFSYVADGKDIAFTDLSTVIDGTVNEWAWSFGDTVTDTIQNPVHTYAERGVYRVGLVVKNSDSTASALYEKPVIVKDTGPVVIEKTRYDTIVGVGDSIAQGEYELTSGMFDAPFRGTNFASGSVPGTTLQFMLDNVSNFTTNASGKTLFIVRAGINDCNTYLSPNGVKDGAAGTVESASTFPPEMLESIKQQYRDLVAALKPYGDVALATLTWCDAKGQLSALPDKGASLHCGSWNDLIINPLCQELTPEFFDAVKGRPVFDYYTKVLEDISILDTDNLHFYGDLIYRHSEVGYPNPAGSYTIRQYTLEKLAESTSFQGTPYDPEVYSNRVLINIGKGPGLRGRPSFQRWANNIDYATKPTQIANLVSYNGVTDYMFTMNDTGGSSARSNLYTSPQPWHEGIQDRNIASSSVFISSDKVITVTLTNLNAKGKVRMLGLFVSEGAGSMHDATQLTEFTVIDSNGTNVLSKPSSINHTDVNLVDCVAEFDFDCTGSQDLVIQVRKGAGSQYGCIGAVELDII